MVITLGPLHFRGGSVTIELILMVQNSTNFLKDYKELVQMVCSNPQNGTGHYFEKTYSVMDIACLYTECSYIPSVFNRHNEGELPCMYIACFISRRPFTYRVK